MKLEPQKALAVARALRELHEITLYTSVEIEGGHIEVRSEDQGSIMVLFQDTSTHRTFTSVESFLEAYGADIKEMDRAR